MSSVRSATYKQKAPSQRRGFEKALILLRSSVAQLDRPAEAGMMVPVVVRDAEHP
jgi:hypothetical protein